MLRELLEEPQWAKDLTETNKPRNCFLWENGHISTTGLLCNIKFLVSFRHEIKARNDTLDIVTSLNNFSQYLFPFCRLRNQSGGKENYLHD